MTRHLTTSYVEALRAAGLNVETEPGWLDRGRDPEHGDFNPHASLWHHTGSPDKNPASNADDDDYAHWLFTIGRPDLGPPLCQVTVYRSGKIRVGAAGRANHAGVARSSGPMPGGDGNTMYVGFECQNTGTEGWGKNQYEAMVTAAAATDIWGGWGADYNRAHKETSVTGKWDPGGLDMARFRIDIAHAKIGKRPPQMGPVQKARLNVVAMIAQGEQAIEHLRDEAGPSRPAAFAQRVPIRAAINLCKGVLRVLPAVKKN